jgi:hypothetical protein
LLAVAAVASAMFIAGPAAAADPCWKTLIDDWYDGRIDNVYPVACYRAALEHMPEDVAQYSSLGDDINRALQAAIAAGGSNGGGSNGQTTSGSPDSGGSSGVKGTSTKPANSTFHGGPTSERSGALTAGRDGGGGPVPSAINAIGPGSADSVPVPLIVLGALSVVLLTLGAAGFAARRVQARRATVRAGSQP